MGNFYNNGEKKATHKSLATPPVPDGNHLKSLRKEIGSRIKEICKQSRLSQEAFARSLGVSKSALNRYISGKNEPKASAIKLLLDNFGVNPAWLITGRGPQYFKGVEEEGILYSAGGREDAALEEVVKKLFQQPELVQILHKLFKTDPSQKETLEAYLMALEIALRAQEKEKRKEGEEDENSGHGL